jgi:integrase
MKTTQFETFAGNKDFLVFFETVFKQYEKAKEAEKGKIEKRRYYLFKRASKKYGFIYNVKYIDPQTNAILPTKYSTGTNDFETANKWAADNRDKLLAAYSGKAELTLLESYYNEGSKLFDYEKMDGRELSPKVRKQRKNFMIQHIVPFFQRAKVHYLSQITPIHIKELKKYLSTEKGLKPQTINYNLYSFKKCLAILKEAGKITAEFSNVSFRMNGSKKAEKERGIFAIDTLKGVFSKRWNNELSRVLCMVIYTTGIRNSEIQRLRLNDIEKIDEVYFLNVRGTKSKNAIRKVAIHPILYTAIERYAKENGIGNEAAIFGKVINHTFRKACFDMGSVLGITETELLKKAICFYSGRHTFKSIMAIGNAEQVAELDINYQELFMGHNFSKEALKGTGINEYAYKHFDAESIGDTLFAKKGKEVIKILNHYYF